MIKIKCLRWVIPPPLLPSLLPPPLLPSNDSDNCSDPPGFIAVINPACWQVIPPDLRRGMTVTSHGELRGHIYPTCLHAAPRADASGQISALSYKIIATAISVIISPRISIYFFASGCCFFFFF